MARIKNGMSQPLIISYGPGKTVHLMPGRMMLVSSKELETAQIKRLLQQKALERLEEVPRKEKEGRKEERKPPVKR